MVLMAFSVCQNSFNKFSSEISMHSVFYSACITAYLAWINVTMLSHAQFVKNREYNVSRKTEFSW